MNAADARREERTMIRKTETIAMTVLFIAVHCTMALGQAPPPTILVIDLENYVDYQDDIGVPSKYATNPNIPPRSHANELLCGQHARRHRSGQWPACQGYI